MTSRSKPPDAPETDWWAVAQAAQGLGINTRRLVALRDTDAAIDWCLQMRREHGLLGQVDGVASLSYYEIAVMLGHRDKKLTETARLDWSNLLGEVEALAGAVKIKVAEEKRAAEEAAAAAQAAAEKEAAEREAAERAEEEQGVDELEEFADADTLEDGEYPAA
jgi:hypothetical protein